jgi:hypothetical protein
MHVTTFEPLTRLTKYFLSVGHQWGQILYTESLPFLTMPTQKT